MNLVQFKWNERNSSTCYATATYLVHAFKKKKKIPIKKHFCLSFYRLYLFIRSCKFVVIETCTYDIAQDENAMSLLIIQSI